MGGEPATTAVSPGQEGEHSWPEAGKYIWGIPLMLLLFVIVAAISPMLLWLYIWDKAHSPASGNATADGTNSRKCHDYAQDVEDITSYRRRAEEAEREVERLRKELRDN